MKYKFFYLIILFFTHFSRIEATPIQDFTYVAKEAIPAVVSVQVVFQNKHYNEDFIQDDFFQRFFGLPRGGSQVQSGQASGFIISSDGYIITNSHVVKDASSIKVILNDEKEFSATVVGQDPSTDVALLKIDAKNLPYLKLGNSDTLDVGQWVIAIGNPFGLQASLTVGVVSAKGRNNLDLASVEDFIQTDAAINRGNSGGPLLEMNGEVIGMNTAIVSNASSGGYVGIGFAIPSNLVSRIVEQLKTSGKVARGFLGVILQQMSQDLALAFNLEKSEGALIAEVSLGSPAEKAGLRPGDLILTYGGLPVRNIGSLRTAIALMPPGTSLSLTVLRAGNKMTIPVEIGAFPSQTEAAKIEENALGFEVQNLSPELASKLGVSVKEGVVVTQVSPNSPAAWIGFKKGIVILEVNQRKVTDVASFQSALAETPKGKPILFLVKYGDSTRFISFKSE